MERDPGRSADLGPRSNPSERARRLRHRAIDDSSGSIWECWADRDLGRRRRAQSRLDRETRGRAQATRHLLRQSFCDRRRLMSFGADRLEQFRRAASYVDRILKGERPADLPVQAPSKYELVVNLK